MIFEMEMFYRKWLRRRAQPATTQPDGVTLLRTLASINGQRVKEPTPELARMHAALKAGGLIVEAGRGTGWVSYASLRMAARCLRRCDERAVRGVAVSECPGCAVCVAVVGRAPRLVVEKQ